MRYQSKPLHDLASASFLSKEDRKAYLDAMAKDARKIAGQHAIADAKALAKTLKDI